MTVTVLTLLATECFYLDLVQERSHSWDVASSRFIETGDFLSMRNIQCRSN